MNHQLPQVVTVGVAAVGAGPMREDAIRRIQSMTRPITAVAALRLVEAGRLGLDEGLEEWLPELADRRVLTSPTAALDDTVAAHRSITLRDLLTNASGYGMALVDSPCCGRWPTTAPRPVRSLRPWVPRNGSLDWPNSRSPSHREKAGDTTTRSACSASSSPD